MSGLNGWPVAVFAAALCTLALLRAAERPEDEPAVIAVRHLRMVCPGNLRVVESLREERKAVLVECEQRAPLRRDVVEM